LPNHVIKFLFKADLYLKNHRIWFKTLLPGTSYRNKTVLWANKCTKSYY